MSTKIISVAEATDSVRALAGDSPHALVDEATEEVVAFGALTLNTTVVIEGAIAGPVGFRVDAVVPD